ncbi:MAG: hypothetical protein II028_08880 [Clostridia bacterium]|nr:hypothetical protein [Clostridia bacterium]
MPQPQFCHGAIHGFDLTRGIKSRFPAIFPDIVTYAGGVKSFLHRLKTACLCQAEFSKKFHKIFPENITRSFQKPSLQPCSAGVN